MLKYPEACLLAGTWLVVSGVGTAGWVVIGLSAVLSFFRFSIEINEKKQKQENVSESMKTIGGVLENLIFNAGTTNGKKRDTTLH